MSPKTTSQTQQSSSESDTVLADLSCNHCGYNLRGLRRDAKCPECAGDVANSLRGDLLSAADPEWLLGVYRGFRQVEFGMIGLIVGVMAIPTVLGWVGLWLLRRGGAVPVVLAELSYALFCGGGLVLMLLGVVAITHLDPRLSLTEQPIARRRVARGAAVVALSCGFLYFGAVLLIALGGTLDPGYLLANRWAVFVTVALTITAIQLYIARLALRIPNRRLARWIAMTSWAFAVCITCTFMARVVLALCNASSPFEVLRKPKAFDTVDFVMACFTGVSIICTVLLLGGWEWMAKAIKRCTKPIPRSHIDRL